jgi:hypothetical protein
MGMVNLIAKMAFPYCGRSLSIGDRFSATEKDAATLKLIGRAVDAPRLRRKDLTAEVPQSENTVERTKRQYQRRDLVPEQ